MFLLSCDRVLALWTPIAYREHSSAKIAIVATLLVHLLVAFMCFPTVILFEVEDEVCGIFNLDFLGEKWTLWYINITVFGFLFGLAFVAMFISNCLVVYKLRNRMSTLSRNDRDVSVSLIVVSAAFFVNNFATAVGVIWTNAIDVQTPRDKAMKDVLDIAKVGNNLSEKLMPSRHLRLY